MEKKTHYHELIDEIVEHGDIESMEGLSDLLVEAMMFISNNSEKEHEKLMQKLEKLAQPVHLSEKEAMHYVKQLKHKDGTIGEKYSYDFVESVMDRSPELNKHNVHDVYFVMNKIHSVFYKKTWDKDTYILLTEMYFDDIEKKENKARKWAISCYGEYEHEEECVS